MIRLWPSESPPILNRLRARIARSQLHQERGDAVIEMAVVMPVFTLLLLGVFQFSMALTGYLSAEYAINVATHYAATHSSTSLAPCSTTDIENLIQSTIFAPNSNPSTTSVAYYQFASTGGNVVGNVVYVSVVFTQTISVPFYNHTFSIGSSDYRMIIR